MLTSRDRQWRLEVGAKVTEIQNFLLVLLLALHHHNLSKLRAHNGLGGRGNT